MSNDFIQNAVNNLYRDNELMALKGELSNLKAERDQLKVDLEKSDGVVWTLSVENARLKAECQARQAENSVLAVECDSLKAQVERLTKAGDNLERVLTSHISSYEVGSASHEWRAAKGVQS
jgi:chromosome segregation ATPase